MAPLRSVRFRLTLWYVVLLAVILAAFSAGIYLTLRHSLFANLDESLDVRTSELFATVELIDGGPTFGTAAPNPGPDDDERFVQLYSPTGTLLFDATEAAGPVALDQDDLGAALNGQQRRGSVSGGDDTFRVRYAPIQQDSAVDGVLVVGLAQSDVEETLSRLVLILIVAYPVTIGVAVGGGLFLANRALAPVDQLTRVARRISVEDLDQRLDLGLPDDEIGRLALTFDDMLARLHTSFAQQRQFTADASHELRTPLTTIKGEVEVALTRERTPDDYREVLALVNDETDRLIRLVGSLLTLARADAGQLALTVEPVDVADLVQSAVEQVQPLAQQRGVSLAIEAGPPATLRADQDLLLHLLLNLLDNAVKHTPSGGSVTAHWETTDGDVSIHITDTGPGIAPEHLPHVFDRFYRVDTARSRAAGGIGLGLSISKWIAESHGGTISAASQPGAGTVMTVTLPRA